MWDGFDTDGNGGWFGLENYGIFHLQMGSQKHIRYVSWDEIFLFFEGDNIGIWKSYLMNSVHIQYKYPLVI